MIWNKAIEIQCCKCNVVDFRYKLIKHGTCIGKIISLVHAGFNEIAWLQCDMNLNKCVGCEIVLQVTLFNNCLWCKELNFMSNLFFLAFLWLLYFKYFFVNQTKFLQMHFTILWYMYLNISIYIYDIRMIFHEYQGSQWVEFESSCL